MEGERAVALADRDLQPVGQKNAIDHPNAQLLTKFKKIRIIKEK